MKLIIDIPYDEYYECRMQAYMIKQERPVIENLSLALKIHVADGKLLDDELQEIRQEIKDSAIEWYLGRLGGESEEVLSLDDVLKIIDTHISAWSGKEEQCE